MKAVILAGGLGLRLRPLTNDTPKPLLPIGESTAIEIAIRGLQEHGVREIFIATRYRAEQVETFLGDGSKYGVKLHYSVEDEPLGTCGPLGLLKAHLTERFILMNGDIVTNLDFGNVMRFANKKEAQLTVVTKEDVMNCRYGVVRADGDFVLGIDEKPSLSTEVLTGIYVASPRIFDLIPEERSYGIDELINDLLAQDRGVARFITDAYWRDVGDIESLKEANNEYAEHFGPGKKKAKKKTRGKKKDRGQRKFGLGKPLDPAASSSDAPSSKGAPQPPQNLAEVWERALPFLQNPYVIVLSLFVLATVHYVLKNTMAYGEVQTLMYAKQFADPDFLPGDWYLNRSQPVRVPFQILMYPLVKLFPLHIVSIIARLLSYLFVSIALGLLAHRLRMNAVYAWIALGAFLWLDQALLPGEEWILKRAESKVIAYGFVLFALRALLDRRLRLAGTLAGLATTLHILVGGWSTAALGLTILSQRIGDWRERWIALGCWCLGASMAIGCVIAKLLEPAGPEGFDSAHLWAHFRNPHYSDVAEYWELAGNNTFVFLILLAFLGWAPTVFPDDQGYAITSRFALWTLAPFALGMAVQPFSIAPDFLQYMPFRVSDTLIPLIGLLIAAQMALTRMVWRPLHVPVALALTVFFGWSAWDGLATGLKYQERYPRGGYWGSRGETQELYEICEWVRENTRRGGVMIVSPKINVIPYHCERPVVVTFRDVPSGAADLAEWYQRLIDFNGGEEPSERGYAARSEIDRNFNRLSTRNYVELGKKYDGHYLLVYDNEDVELPLVYDVDDWSLYALRSGGE